MSADEPETLGEERHVIESDRLTGAQAPDGPPSLREHDQEEPQEPQESPATSATSATRAQHTRALPGRQQTGRVLTTDALVFP